MQLYEQERVCFLCELIKFGNAILAVSGFTGLGSGKVGSCMDNVLPCLAACSVILQHSQYGNLCGNASNRKIHVNSYVLPAIEYENKNDYNYIRA